MCRECLNVLTGRRGEGGGGVIVDEDITPIQRDKWKIGRGRGDSITPGYKIPVVGPQRMLCGWGWCMYLVRGTCVCASCLCTLHGIVVCKAKIKFYQLLKTNVKFLEI